MKKEIEETILNKYPIFYQTRNDPPTKSLMCFGLQCGDGWFELIDNVSSKFENLNKTLEEQIVAMQVKEKYGGLRIYINSLKDKSVLEQVLQLTAEAEEKSFKICESCGKYGILHNVNGWLMVRCDDCLKRKKKKD